MTYKRRVSPLTATAACALMLAACASEPNPQSADADQRDAPKTGSHIGKRYNNGPDASGVTTYGAGALSGSPTGNGLPGGQGH